MSVLKKSFGLLLVLLLFQSCRNYESEEYYREEHLAYQQLISEFISLRNLPVIEEGETAKPILYVISELDNKVEVTPQYLEIYDGDGDDKYAAYHEELSESTIEERKHFKPLLKERLELRNLTGAMAYDSLDIQLISRKKYELLTAKGLSNEFRENPEFFGYLFLSRIVLNRDYTVGYLNYMFYCGTGCFWTNNAEIRKVNGKWTITEHYSGGTA